MTRIDLPRVRKSVRTSCALVVSRSQTQDQSFKSQPRGDRISEERLTARAQIQTPGIASTTLDTIFHIPRRDLNDPFRGAGEEENRQWERQTSGYQWAPLPHERRELGDDDMDYAA